MTTSNAIKPTMQVTNGVDVDQVLQVIGSVESDPSFARFQFRARNQWIDGGLNRSRIKDYFAGNAENTSRTKAFTLDSDEPPMMAGQDSAPNAIEFVLHALASCLTTSLIYHAAVRGIEIESVESSYTGDIDVRGLLGLSEDVRKGCNRITVDMRVRSQASAEDLTPLALYSPVHDMLSRSLPVEFVLTTV